MIEKINSIRMEYALASLTKADMGESPFMQFDKWMREAFEAEVKEPIAATLSTVDQEGKPSARVVLMRGAGENGFVFYTNYESRKAQDLFQNPHVSLSFYWPELQRQVRIEGVVQKMSAEGSEQYFAGRPRGSQIGAWASAQSQEIESRQALVVRFKEFEEKFADNEEIPRPEFWGGFIVKPGAIEFWQGRESRLHDRFKYDLEDAGEWRMSRLSP